MTVATATLTLALAAAGAVAGTFICRVIARRWGIVSMPNPIVQSHVRPIPYLGGIGVALGVAVGTVVGSLLGSDDIRTSASTWRWEIIVGSLLFLALGTADDLKVFRPARKLALQAGAASLVALIAVSRTGDWTASLVAALGIILLTNAVNVVDVSDGLAAGTATIAALVLAVLAGGRTPLPLALAGACIGFLLFNAPPATIFLGDAGSHLIGFLLAMISVDAWSLQPTFGSAAAITLVNGVALFEIVFLIVTRTARGIPWWRGSPDHVALRLQARGFSPWKSNGVAWLFGAILAGLALASRRDTTTTWICLMTALIVGGLAGRWLFADRRFLAS